MTIRRFFKLVAVDPATESVVHDVRFEVADLGKLRVLSGIDSAEFDPRASYEIDAAEAKQVAQAFGVEFDPGDLLVRFEPSYPIDELPYKIHTNRELRLMLEGTKPLAAFIDSYPSTAGFNVIPEHVFDPHVQAGTLVKFEEVSTVSDRDGHEHRVRTVLYSLPEEQWRIPAYLLLLRTAAKAGWNDFAERMQGSLLGYEDWQNDAFMEARKHWDPD